MKTDPQSMTGPWERGFTLDVHTVGSEFLGYDLEGRPQFDTVRSELGEALYRCKYRSDRAACAAAARAAAEHLRAHDIAADVLVPVPPSRIRPFQPLDEISTRLAAELNIAYDPESLQKVKETLELKSLAEVAERTEALRDAFQVRGDALRGRSVLLFDDLYRSGASMGAAARVLRDSGGVARITALALTRTRTKT